MGATQKCFPTPISFDAILTDADRQTAESYEFELAQGTARQLASRQYLAYIALTRASGHLYITYPSMDDQGRSLRFSFFYLSRYRRRTSCGRGAWFRLGFCCNLFFLGYRFAGVVSFLGDIAADRLNLGAYPYHSPARPQDSSEHILNFGR